MSYKIPRVRQVYLVPNVPFQEVPYRGVMQNNARHCAPRRIHFSEPLNQTKRVVNSQPRGMAKDIWYPVLSVLNAVCLVTLYIIDGLAAISPHGDLFVNNVDYQKDVTYATDVTPATWSFATWVIIHVWHGLWVLYSLVNICRRHWRGPVPPSPVILPPMLFLTSIIVFSSRIAWLLFFDRGQTVAFAAILILHTVLVYIAMAVAYHALDKSCAKLLQQRRRGDIWMSRLLLHNGFGLHAGWITVEAAQNIAILMTYGSGAHVGREQSGLVAILIVNFILVTFSVLDLFYLDKFSRYTLTPYLGVVVGMAGVVGQNYREGDSCSLFSLVVLCVAGLLLFVKLWVALYRHVMEPQFGKIVREAGRNARNIRTSSEAASWEQTEAKDVSDMVNLFIP